jgi:UDP-N-acetyl-D-mannosaminuronic acid transferase (WecB/TagA/CpsF family)
MAQCVGRIEAAALIGVGAAFDFLSGENPLAPMDAALRARVAFSFYDGAAAVGA